MFKKFFNWIIDTFKRIGNRIEQKKLEEFYEKLDVYYVPEDFHTNPKYRVYDNLYPISDYNKNLKKDNKLPFVVEILISVVVSSITRFILD